MKVEFDKDFFKNLGKLQLKAKKKKNKLTQQDISNFHYDWICELNSRIVKLEKDIKGLK